MRLNTLDQVDRGILYLLQDDARSNTTSEIAERVGVGSSTVASRIRKLEDRDIITGYNPAIDYEKAGFENHVIVLGTAPIPERTALVDEILEVFGVVGVRELLTNHRNVSIDLVTPSRDELEQSIGDLSEAGLDIESIELVRREIHQPFNHFGEHVGE